MCNLALRSLKTYLHYQMPMTTKLDRVVTYNEELPSINPYDPSVTSSCEVMLQNQYLIFPLALDKWPSNMVKWWWLIVRGFHPQSPKSLSTWSGEVTWQIKNIKSPLSQCLSSPNLSDTPLWHTARSSHPQSHMTLYSCGLVWGHTTNQIRYIFTCRKPIGIKLGKAVISCGGLPPKSPITIWLRDRHAVTWEIQKIYFHSHKN